MNHVMEVLGSWFVGDWKAEGVEGWKRAKDAATLLILNQGVPWTA